MEWPVRVQTLSKFCCEPSTERDVFSPGLNWVTVRSMTGIALCLSEKFHLKVAGANPDGLDFQPNSVGAFGGAGAEPAGIASQYHGCCKLGLAGVLLAKDPFALFLKSKVAFVCICARKLAEVLERGRRLASCANAEIANTPTAHNEYSRMHFFIVTIISPGDR